MYVFLVIKMKNLRSKRTNEGLIQWSSGQDSGLPCQGAQVPPLVQRAGASLLAQKVKASAYKAGDPGLIPGSGRSPGEGNGNALQYSCLENPMAGGAWWATVHGVKELDRTERFHFHFLGELRSHRLCGEGKNINQ